jgi:glycosidase
MQKMIIYQIFTRLFGNKISDCIPHADKKRNGVGKFKDITSIALQEIKKLGITHVWYTGIVEHAIIDGYDKNEIAGHNPLIVKGRAGSPYAICDYYDVNPDLAINVENRMLEFEQLIVRTHNNDLKVIVDFVPNHLARQYKSDQKPVNITDFGENDDKTKAFDNQNNFYYLPDQELVLPDELIKKTKDNYSFDPYIEFPAKVTGNDKFDNYLNINDWYETIKLNYGINYRTGERVFDPIPDTWLKMLDVLLFWASKKVDAYRCDMAEMVPVEFWNWVIPKVKIQYPEIIFIAEIYNPEQYSSYLNFGFFDYLYDKVGLYDAVKRIIQNQSFVDEISKCWQELSGINAKMLRFLENHDEQRIASRFFAGNPLAAIPGVVVSLMMNNGPFMLYFGQEVGEPANGESGFSGDDGRTTIFDYWNVPEHQKWMNNGKFDGGLLSDEQKKLRNTYQFLLNFSINNEAISSGKFYDLMWGNEYKKGLDTGRVYAFLRYTKKQQFLIIANFFPDEMNINLVIHEHALNEMNLSTRKEFEFTSIKPKFNKHIHYNELINYGIQINIPGFGFEIIRIS